MSVLETIAEQAQENGKIISFAYDGNNIHSECYSMDETTEVYISFDSIGKVREVIFYTR